MKVETLGGQKRRERKRANEGHEKKNTRNKLKMNMTFTADFSDQAISPLIIQ